MRARPIGEIAPGGYRGVCLLFPQFSRFMQDRKMDRVGNTSKNKNRHPDGDRMVHLSLMNLTLTMSLLYI
jgi:hypothetical protein